MPGCKGWSFTLKALKQGLQEELVVTPDEICHTVFISLRGRQFPSWPPGKKRSRRQTLLAGFVLTLAAGTRKPDSLCSY